jgi:hypothetical protein
LLLKAFGAAALVGPALAEVPGVEQAFLFGSWAARHLGEAGPEPADLDVSKPALDVLINEGMIERVDPDPGRAGPMRSRSPPLRC